MGQTTSSGQIDKEQEEERNNISVGNNKEDSNEQKSQIKSLKNDLTLDDIQELSTAANSCLVDVSALNRKYSTQNLVRILLRTRLELLKDKLEVLDVICLALSLSTLSADSDSQFLGLTGLKTLSMNDFCVEALIKAEVPKSLVILLGRLNSTSNIISTSLNILCNICNNVGSHDRKYRQALYQLVGGVDYVISLATKWTNNHSHIEHILIILSTLPNNDKGMIKRKR